MTKIRDGAHPAPTRDGARPGLRRDVAFIGLIWASVGSIIGSGWLYGAQPEPRAGRHHPDGEVRGAFVILDGTPLPIDRIPPRGPYEERSRFLATDRAGPA